MPPSFLVLKVVSLLMGGAVHQRMTFDFGSSHDLKIKSSSPISGSALSTESAWDSLPFPLPLPPLVPYLSVKE